MALRNSSTLRSASAAWSSGSSEIKNGCMPTYVCIPLPTTQKNHLSSEQASDQSNKPTNERTNERANERTNERTNALSNCLSPSLCFSFLFVVHWCSLACLSIPTACRYPSGVVVVRRCASLPSTRLCRTPPLERTGTAKSAEQTARRSHHGRLCVLACLRACVSGWVSE